MSDRLDSERRRCPTVIFMNGRDWQCARIDGHEPDNFQPDTDWSTIGRGCRTFTQPDPGALDTWWKMHHDTERRTLGTAADPVPERSDEVEFLGADMDETARQRVLENA